MPFYFTVDHLTVCLLRFVLFARLAACFLLAALYQFQRAANTAKTAGPAAHFTKLVYFSYGILDRQSDAGPFHCEPCIPPFPLLRLDNACPFTPAALSVAGGRTNTEKVKTQTIILSKIGHCY